MGLFRRSETVQDASQRHSTLLDLIEQLAALRGQVRTIEAEWDDMRAQIRKGYQRMEKAHERLAESPPDEHLRDEDVLEPKEQLENGARFIQKLAMMKR